MEVSEDGIVWTMVLDIKEPKERTEAQLRRMHWFACRTAKFARMKMIKSENSVFMLTEIAMRVALPCAERTLNATEPRREQFSR